MPNDKVKFQVILLTCDSFGVMPPLARLNPAQSMYHFMSGYTAKVAGTEKEMYFVHRSGEYFLRMGEYFANKRELCRDRREAFLR